MKKKTMSTADVRRPRGLVVKTKVQAGFVKEQGGMGGIRAISSR